MRGRRWCVAPRRTRAMNASSKVGIGQVGASARRRAVRPGVPTAASRPWLTMPSRSQYSASSMKWLVTRMVTPASASAPMRFQNSRRVSGSTPEVGSSRNRISGACSSAAASARRCLRPSGRSCGHGAGEVGAGRSAAAPRRSRAPARRGSGRRRGRRSAGSRAPTVRHRARSAAPCSRCASVPRRGRAAGPAPATRALPPDGRSRPHSMRKVVDLPAPFGPSRPKISPRCTAKLTWSTAMKSRSGAPGRALRWRRAWGVARRSLPPLEGGGWGEGLVGGRHRPTPAPDPARLKGRGRDRRCRRSRAMKPSSKRGGSGSSAMPPSASAPASRRPRAARCAARRRRPARRAPPGCCRGAPGDGAAAAGGHGQAEHPPVQRREELVRRRVGQQLALVQQQHAAAARGLVEIGGGPDHGHAVGAAFLQHGA